MRRASLETLPKIAVPEGDRIRKATFPDAQNLSVVLAASFPEFGWEPAKVRSELLLHEEVFSTYVVQRGKRVVATASCKRTTEAPGSGYVHWVAVHPDAQGSRLGRAVCLAVLKGFVKEGYQAAILDTDVFRLPAIKTYLQLDFEPVIRDEADQAAWVAILAKLAP